MKLIKNVKIFTGRGEIIEDGAVLIENGKIKEVGKNLSLDQGEVIDGKGLNLYPGFVEAHSHLGLWEDSIGFEGSDGNEVTDPITPQLRAIDAVNPLDGYFKDAYRGGVTTANVGPGSANVVGGTFLAIKTYGDRVDDMVILNPSGMKIAFGENPKRVYGQNGKAPLTRMAIASLLRELILKTEEYMEKKNSAKDKKDMPAIDMKYEAMIPVLEKKIPLKAHAHRADDIFTAIRVAKEFDLNLTLDHCTDGSLIKDHLAKEGYPAIVGPTFGDRGKFELRNKSFKTPNDLYQAGVKFAITTDSPVIPLENLPMCAGLAVKEGLPEEEALKAITIYPAEIVGIADRVGSIEVGKDADLVLIDGNPLKDLGYNVEFTMIDGEIVYKR